MRILEQKGVIVDKLSVINKTIHLEYEIFSEIEAGLVLKSDEVKSLRKSMPSLQPSYCHFHRNEIYITHLNLNYANNPSRDKKLLMHRKEISKFMSLFSKKSYLIIPMELYDKNGIFKVKIGAGTKLKKVDKREAIKEKEMKNTVKNFIF